MGKIRVAECPNCGEILAFYASYKTKLCTRCGKRFDVLKSKIYGVFDNALKASEFVKKLKYSRKNARKYS
ncbi:MAG: DUF1922 domain-containing protein [Thermoproteota archaeon]|jgi:DNA-directed RNA polymerase subunit RPC12/RpoP|nr:DUF1922 domain-containing protein [Thermoproteota archaeon]